MISDTFFLLANRSIDPNLRAIATSYIVHYDYKEARFFFHYLTQRLDWGIRSFNSLSAMTPKRCDPFFLSSKTPKRSNFAFAKSTFSGPGQCDREQGGDGRGEAVVGLLHEEELHQQVWRVQHAHHEGPMRASQRLDLAQVHFQECLFPFGVAYALQKDSPYTKRLLTFFLNNSRIPSHPWLSSKIGLKIPIMSKY